RAGEASRVVLEDAKSQHLPAERVHVGLAVVAADPEQHAEAPADRPDRLAVDRDAGLAHPLHDGAHERVKARLAQEGEKLIEGGTLARPRHSALDYECPIIYDRSHVL